MIIDATNLIAGRIGTVAAKKAMTGESVIIMNSEKAVVTGKKQSVLMEKKQKADRGTSAKGPFIPKTPERYLKRIIRGMLPYKLPKGAASLKRIRCYAGVPDKYKDQKAETIQKANVSKLPYNRYLTIRDICRHLGGKT